MQVIREKTNDQFSAKELCSELTKSKNIKLFKLIDTGKLINELENIQPREINVYKQFLLYACLIETTKQKLFTKNIAHADLIEQIQAKFDCIDERLRESQNFACRLAVLLYVFQKASDKFKSCLLTYMVLPTNESKDADLDFAYFKRKLVTSKSSLSWHKLDFTSLLGLEQNDADKQLQPLEKKVRLQFMKTLLEIADLTKSESTAALAYTLDPKLYLESVQDNIANKITTHLEYFYSPFFNLYKAKYMTRGSISPSQMSALIKNRFGIMNIDYIGQLYKEMQEKDAEDAKRLDVLLRCSAKPVKELNTMLLDDETIYEVYAGDYNFPSQIVYTTIENKWRVALYLNALYDVFGCNASGSGVQSNEQIAAMCWSARLDLVDYRDKIALKTLKGSEIKKITNKCTVAFSFKEKNTSHYTTKCINIADFNAASKKRKMDPITESKCNEQTATNV